jgi:bifunctional DNA-binding transcriptional regulator/antitoxin component of YhaV-PrlF toxin-antitoxin module
MPRHKDQFRGQVLKDGRITIPLAVRKNLKIEVGQFFHAEVVDNDTIKIKFFRV